MKLRCEVFSVSPLWCLCHYRLWFSDKKCAGTGGDGCEVCGDGSKIASPCTPLLSRPLLNPPRVTCARVIHGVNIPVNVVPARLYKTRHPATVWGPACDYLLNWVTSISQRRAILFSACMMYPNMTAVSQIFVLLFILSCLHLYSCNRKQ